MSCGSEDISKLIINVTIKSYGSEGMAKGKDVKKVLRN